MCQHMSTCGRDKSTGAVLYISRGMRNEARAVGGRDEPFKPPSKKKNPPSKIIVVTARFEQSWPGGQPFSSSPDAIAPVIVSRSPKRPTRPLSAHDTICSEPWGPHFGGSASGSGSGSEISFSTISSTRRLICKSFSSSATCSSTSSYTPFCSARRCSCSTLRSASSAFRPSSMLCLVSSSAMVPRSTLSPTEK